MDSAPWQNWKVRFTTIWIGQAFSLFGSMLVQFALVWWLTDSTGSATVLATASLIALLPQIFFSPVAGTLVDRWNRRRVMIAADTVVALATVWIVYLFAVDAAEVWHIYLVLLIRSMGGAFHWPAMQASTSLMVPAEHLARVSGFNQMLQGAINIVAPPMGALLLEALPMQGVLSIDIVTAAIAITPLLFIAIPQPEVRQTHKMSVLHDMIEGLRYTQRWRGLMIIFVMAIMINFLFYPAFSLMPILVTDHFGGEALELGWLEAMWGIGIVLGGLILGIWGGFKKRRTMLTPGLGLVGQGIGMVVVSLAPSGAFWIALGGMFFTGIMFPITNGPLQAILQRNVDPEMQGRVFTLFGSVGTAMTPLSLLVAGPIADALGVQIWYIGAGIVTGLLGLAGLFIPPLLNLENDMQAAKIRSNEQAAQVQPIVAA